MRVQRDSRRLRPRAGTCVLGYDFCWFSFLPMVRFFWKLISCLHPLLSFIHTIRIFRAPTMSQTFLEASLQVKWEQQLHHGSTASQGRPACAPPPHPKKTRDALCLLRLPPVTRYLLPSQAAAAHSTAYFVVVCPSK